MNQTMGNPDDGSRAGEVVAASTTEFTTRCHALYEAPPLGALVKSGGESPVYGVVAEVSTQSIDPALTAASDTLAQSLR